MNRNVLGFLYPVFYLMNRVISKPRVRILMFHDVPSAQFNQFETKIAMIKKKYNVIDFQEFENIISGKQKSHSKISILFTFDDGFKSNYSLSKILDKHDIKGVFFIAPEFQKKISKKEQREFIKHNLFLDQIKIEDITEEMEPLTWDEIIDMERSGHTIGLHTMTHAKLSLLNSDDEIEKEISDSKDILEQRLDHPVNIIAYPFGDISSISKNAIQQIRRKYLMLFSAVRGFNDVTLSPYEIRRDQADVTMTDNYLRFIIEGGLDIKYKKPRNILSQMNQ